MKQKSVGRNIRYYRNKLNLTQQELADKIGLTWEMISRYEHGKSSPMERIDELAKALEISSIDLMSSLEKDGSTEKGFNEIPLFVKPAKDSSYISENTDLFYPAPTWMVKRDKNLFAVSADIIEIKTVRLDKVGIFFIAPSPKPKITNFVLAIANEKLLLDTLENVNKLEAPTILGTLIAQELRF